MWLNNKNVEMRTGTGLLLVNKKCMTVGWLYSAVAGEDSRYDSKRDSRFKQ